MSHSEHATQSTNHDHGEGGGNVALGKRREEDQARTAEPEVEQVDAGPDKEPPTRPA